MNIQDSQHIDKHSDVSEILNSNIQEILFPNITIRMIHGKIWHTGIQWGKLVQSEG